MSRESFRKFSHKIVFFVGSAWAFFLAVAGLVLWLIIGIYLHFSQEWQLVFTIGTPAITFLLLFLIQHKQNRDAAVMNIKLDELLLASKHARNTLIDAENLSDSTLEEHKEDLIHQAKK